MKLISFFIAILFAHPVFAQDCRLNNVAASAMAELFVLNNEREIRTWVEITDLSAFAKEVASKGEYSKAQDTYFFEIVTYPNNGGSWHTSAWLEVSCSGVHLNYQLVDQR